MNGKDIFKAIGQAPDEYIDALETQPTKRKPLYRLAALAACLCLVIGAAAHFSGRESYPVKEIYISSQTEELSGEVAIIPRWDEMSITQQFGHMYDWWSCGGVEVPAEMVGESLGTVTLTGYDVYEDKEHSIEAETFAISGISTDCARAVKYDGHDEYYSFYNSHWRPETLGQFIEELNLKEHISFGKVHYDYQKSRHEHASVQFEGITTDMVWGLLMSSPEAENIHDDLMMTRRIMDISVDIPLLGFKNISLAVTEEGYLTTNILATGKTFDIGKDKVEAFVEYVKENLQGYEIVYYEEPVMEEESAGENATEQSTPAYDPTAK